MNKKKQTNLHFLCSFIKILIHRNQMWLQHNLDGTELNEGEFLGFRAKLKKVFHDLLL